MNKLLFFLLSLLSTLNLFANNACNDSTILQEKFKLSLTIDSDWGLGKNQAEKDGGQQIDCYQTATYIEVVTSLSEQLQYVIADKRNHVIDQDWVLPFRGIPIKNLKPDVYQIILFNNNWLFTGTFYIK